MKIKVENILEQIYYIKQIQPADIYEAKMQGDVINTLENLKYILEQAEKQISDNNFNII
jgi:hypothetical protein